jgi:hypothetical protein
MHQNKTLSKTTFIYRALVSPLTHANDTYIQGVSKNLFLQEQWEEDGTGLSTDIRTFKNILFLVHIYAYG